MAEYTGSALFVKFGATVLNADYRSFKEEHSQDSVEASAGSDTRRTYLPTLTDGKMSLDLLAQTGGSVLWTALTPGTSGTLEWGPEGTATGKSRYYIVAFVSQRSREFAYDDITTISAEFTPNAGSTVTETVY